jgi:hypothetical protein
MRLAVRYVLFLIAFLVPAPAYLDVAASAAYAQSSCQPLPPASSKGFQSSLDTYIANYCYRGPGWMHDPNVRTSDGVHPFIKIYYSPEMWRWMTVNRRQGDPPNGAMLVKEQYPEIGQPLNGWTVMVKDAGGSHDGWYWAGLAPAASGTDTPTQNTGGGPDHSAALACPQAVYPSVGFGQYCLNCHASAANGKSTYADPKNVSGGINTGSTANSFPPADNIHQRLARKLFQRDILGPSPCMIPESLDHVVARAPTNAPSHFVTSDQCTGCHNATGTISPTTADLPRMLWPNALADPMVNLSPNGEWRFSMMGLSGRDPIFFSQLNSENALHPTLEGHAKDAKPFVQDLCLSCHGVMGERQYFADTNKLFTRDELTKPNSTYGALARDGVSCAACHHISDEGLGLPETFTARFKLGPVNEIYGPYQHKVSTYSMKSAIGMEPKATEQNQIESSKLCGSCHTIDLPVFEASGKQATRNGQPATFFEQTTYLEWLNSSFVNQSCQSCHMQNDYKGNPLSYKIANIEDNEFPAINFRAPDKDITLVKRDDYHRHTLLGINIFALEMFRQFRSELGLYQEDPMLRSPSTTVPGIDTAIATSLESASDKSAQVEVKAFGRNRDHLYADVQITNLVGHNFPSGVGFRRAFVDFQVLDENGRVLWESGKTDREGVILDGSGRPLETEFFTPTQQRIQTHHWLENPIRREDQVQIYEELVRNPEGYLTTSFIALDEKVKDNRLQPRGWSSSGPYASETAPVGTCVNRKGSQRCDPDYQNGSGTNTIRYEIPFTWKTARASSVRATLYYQSIPPYYLRQRATDAVGTDTNRLVRFTHDIQLKDTPVKNWKLPIASAEMPIDDHGTLPLTVDITSQHTPEVLR